ncbi:5-methylcytosine-specific restriction protein A [Pseudonocardia sediminis]|uniref:5-methylcytosine-specific restriction protein A n=1 Tax=Pseudonocardia sediminis TaxID=1397368 RepID=A0A4Q7UYF2_PSEST|nr:HNH endonuclease signature motif containing protein [Pseudonocardia sediminis]RZT85263.1 5-methylcytosine-specific restriction protein A [Pseudonocardia sediminis]
MSTGRVAAAHDRLIEAVEELRAATLGASDTEQINVLIACEAARRRLDNLSVGVLAGAERRDVFTSRGYKNSASALSDLLGWERFEARRHVMAAENVVGRTALDGTVLPPRLPATAEVFDAGRTSLRHVEVVAKVLATRAAERLTPEVWSAAEAQIGAKSCEYTPNELQVWGTALVEKLDQDGPEPDDDRPEPEVNELRIVRHRNRPGGKITGRFDDAAMFDTIATVIDAKSKPTSSDETREPAQRQAEALAEVCAYALSHGPAGLVPETGGRRPQISVIISLEDLEKRAKTGMLDFGGRTSAETLRMMACDSAVIPIVFDGKGQPLDVGRATRTIPDGLRRAVIARDRGCAHPGCDRPPSWCEVHHVIPWEEHGETKIDNLVMLCRQHHRLIHHPGWDVRIRDGLPEFLPPAWIDPSRTPRRQPAMISIPGQRRETPSDATRSEPARRSGGVRVANLDDLFGLQRR